MHGLNLLGLSWKELLHPSTNLNLGSVTQARPCFFILFGYTDHESGHNFFLNGLSFTLFFNFKISMYSLYAPGRHSILKTDRNRTHNGWNTFFLVMFFRRTDEFFDLTHRLLLQYFPERNPSGRKLVYFEWLSIAKFFCRKTVNRTNCDGWQLFYFPRSW